MITRWELLTKAPGMDDANFRKYWQDVHAPLVLQAEDLRHYTQNFIIDKEQRGVSLPRLKEDADALEEIWFDDLHDMNASLQTAGAAINADFPNFAGEVKTLIGIKSLVIPLADRPLVKRTSFIRMRPDISHEQYKYEWWNVHGAYLRKFKHVHGYFQTLILDRFINGKSVSRDALPIDGIVELYFDDMDSIGSDFASEVGRAATTHAATFLDAISTYVVERNPIKA